MQGHPACVAKPWVPEIEYESVTVENGLDDLDCDAGSGKDNVSLFYAVVCFIDTFFCCKISVRVVHNHCVRPSHVNNLYL